MVKLGRKRHAEASAPAVNPYALPPVEAEEEEVLELDDVLGSAISTDQRPFDQPRGAGLCPVAGGVGVSTLVEYADGALEEPSAERSYAGVILVATTAASHLREAKRLLQRGATADGAQVMGLVLVHDRPKLSPATAAFAKTLRGMSPRLWMVPYVPGLREPVEDRVKVPLRYRQVVTDLVKVTR